MNSGHDLGGMMGFGEIRNDPDESNFHAEWEERVFALTLAVGATGKWNLDESRHVREKLPPAQYLSFTYYQIWLTALEQLLIAKKLVTEEELRRGKSVDDANPVQVLEADNVLPAMMAGSAYDRPATSKASFLAGDVINAKNINPSHHTRIPRYVRGRSGTVESIHGCYVFPDSNSQGAGESPQWLYKVSFSARELWGLDHSENDLVYVDLWESYLEQR